jgi:hypothetical protein
MMTKMYIRENMSPCISSVVNTEKIGFGGCVLIVAPSTILQ